MANFFNEMTAAIDGMIAGKSQATAGRLFSTEDHDAATYVWNASNFLIAGGITNYTCILAWNSLGWSRRAGVMISPCHFVASLHYPHEVGETVRAVAADGTVHTREVIATFSLGEYPNQPDIQICQLDEDMPAGIAFAKIPPLNLASKFLDLTVAANRPPAIMLLGGGSQTSNGSTIYGQYLHPNKLATVRDLWLNDSGTLIAPTDSKRLEFYYDHVIPGDSGNGGFIVVGSELVFLFPAAGVGAGSGWPLYWFIDDINTWMLANGGYTLTVADLSGYDTLSAQTHDAPQTLNSLQEINMADFFWSGASSGARGTIANYLKADGVTVADTLPGVGDLVKIEAAKVVAAANAGTSDADWIVIDEASLAGGSISGSVSATDGVITIDGEITFNGVFQAASATVIFNAKATFNKDASFDGFVLAQTQPWAVFNKRHSFDGGVTWHHNKSTIPVNSGRMSLGL